MQPLAEKFSLIDFSRQRKQAEFAQNGQFSSRFVDDRKNDFHRCVEEIRSELVKLQGRTEEERMEYSELLNRAVLGFSEQRNILLTMIQDLLIKKKMHDILPQHSRYSTLAEAVFAEVIGFNVLELIMKDRTGLEEIQVVGTRIFEMRNGKVTASPHQFASIKDVERVQQNLVLYNHDVLNRKKRWSEAMLSDGSRVTMTGFGFTGVPTLTIRFFKEQTFRLDQLCQEEYATIDDTVKTLLLSLLFSYLNMVIIGATNTGKTNLMKSLIAELPDEERIVTIESRFELNIKRDFPGKNVIEYEIDEDDRIHSSQQAFKLALRQSPKRIVHAEIRDEDANIYVRACTRGHEGSMTSVHVNELEDVPDAIVDMCMLDQRAMNPDRLRRRITEYVTQVGIEMAIVGNKRKIVRIAEFLYEEGEVIVHDLIVYDERANRWRIIQPLSSKVAAKIFRYDPGNYNRLKQMGLVAP